MRRRDHIDFYRNAALRGTNKEYLRRLREAAVRGEELAKEVAQKPRFKPQVQAALNFKRGPHETAPDVDSASPEAVEPGLPRDLGGDDAE